MADGKDVAGGGTYGKCRAVMVDGGNPVALNDRRRYVSDGRMERLPIIISRATRLPLLEPNRYLLALRVRVSATTLVTVAWQLCHIWWWVQACMPDFEKILLNGRIPNFSLVRKGLLPWLKVHSFSKNRIPKTLYVSNDTFNSRLTTLKDYMVQALEGYVAGEHRSPAEVVRCRVQIESLQRLLDSQRLGSQDPEERFALSDEDQQRLFEISSPPSPLNPWRGYICKRRNEAMVHLLFKSGVRRGELGNLRVDDVVLVKHEPFIRVMRRPDDADDPRLRQPVVKSLARAIPIDVDLWQLVEDYIREIRPLTPEALTHPYLFVSSRNGAPLSTYGINEVFSGLSEPMGMRIHPHIGRHTFTTGLEAMLVEDGRSDKETVAMLMNANGWKSEMTVNTYNKRNTEESRIRNTRKHQSNIFQV